MVMSDLPTLPSRLSAPSDCTASSHKFCNKASERRTLHVSKAAEQAQPPPAASAQEPSYTCSDDTNVGSDEEAPSRTTDSLPDPPAASPQPIVHDELSATLRKPRAKRASVAEVLAESENAQIMAELAKLKAKGMLGGSASGPGGGHHASPGAPPAPPLTLPSPVRAPALPGVSSPTRSPAKAGVPRLPSIDHLPSLETHSSDPTAAAGAACGASFSAAARDSPKRPHPPPALQAAKGSFHLPSHIHTNGSTRTLDSELHPDSPCALSPLGRTPSSAVAGKGPASLSMDGGGDGASPLSPLAHMNSSRARRASMAGTGSLISGYYKSTINASALDYKSLDRLPEAVRAALRSHRRRSESGIHTDPGCLSGDSYGAPPGPPGPSGQEAPDHPDFGPLSSMPETSPSMRKARRSSSIMDVDMVLSAVQRSPPSRLDASTLASLPRLPQLMGRPSG